MDINHESSSSLRMEKEKRSSKYLNFKLQPGDEALLELLPTPQRELMTAQGTYQDIARQFNLPIGTVRSRLHRGRAALEKLRDDRSEPDRQGVPSISRQ